MNKGFVALLVLVLPVAASAAGFAKHSLFLSQASVTEGETVRIHAVVNNDSDMGFKGSMVFSDSGAHVGTTSVSLPAREAAAVSVPWTPKAGSHTIVAELLKGAEVVEKQSATFKVAEKPKPAQPEEAQSAAAIESSASLQEGLYTMVPGAAVAEPFFSAVDGGRSSLAGVIDGQIGAAKSHVAPEKSILGAETAKEASRDPFGTFVTVLWTLYLYLLTLLKFIVSNAGVFYPVFALLVLYILWKLFRSFRRA